jgi:acetyl-CoA carboxylase carboxyl transferase subunit alpha
MGICDEIIKEPVGGAHREFEKTVNTLKTSILLEIKKLESIDPEDFLDQRISRYEKMGKISD